MDRLIEKLQIAAAVEPKVTPPTADIGCELVSQGEVERGIVVITQIMTTPGVELVGPLPSELQSRILGMLPAE
jgi:molybdate transport system substrate-binding protein